MLLDRFPAAPRNQRPGWTSLAISSGVHIVLFLLGINLSFPEIPPRAKSEYRQVIAGKEKQIVWYRFNKELPDVSPPRTTKGENRPLKAEVKAKQTMIASPKDAPKRTQMVWSPAPPLARTQPVESPNLLAIRMPEPPPPARKPFVAPADVIRKPAPQISALPDAPAVRASGAKPLSLPDLPKVTKPFEAPRTAKVANSLPTIVPLENAPELRGQIAPQSLRIGELPKPVKRFVAPPSQQQAKTLASVEPLPEAPDLTASFDSTLPQSFHVPMAPPRKPFRAPPAVASARAPRSVQVEAPPDAPQTSNAPGVAAGSGVLMSKSLPSPTPLRDAARGNSKDLNMAAIGLNPSDQARLPVGASPGEFSAGPVIRKEGATSAGEANGLSLPDMFVRGAKGARPDLIARAYEPATSTANIRESMRHAEIGNHGTDPSPVPMKMNGAVQVSTAPDPSFQGRDIFMMAIQMPNLTSYSGSWLMWYAERDARQKGLGNIAPPTAYRKVDPKYIATAVEERIQGRVQLACVIKRDGSVGGVQLLRGIDDRLNRSAAEALSKWEFSPATRNGQAVDVDVIVEIPFQLAPKVKGPY